LHFPELSSFPIRFIKTQVEAVKPLLFILSIAISTILFAQTPEKKDQDSTTLAYALRKGSEVDLHIRLYYMSTNNEKELSDYYALAFGGGLKYQTGIYKGFQFTVGGFFVWNLASSDLTKPDPSTGIYNRYEVGQFDMEDFSNKNDMDRLEDFSLKYHYKNSVLTFGKQVILTPFINPQDGRMRPTGEQGLWLDLKEIKRTRVNAGWLTKISPRGTVRWSDVDESIGIYPTGLSTQGVKSGYKGNLESSGVGILGVNYKLKPNWTIQAWEYYTENIFNTLMFQTDAEWNLGGSNALITGLQYTHQNAINDGGNKDLAKTYFDPRQKSNVFSGRLGLKNKQQRLQFNYTRITADGRFLFPREWGREPMYTFMKRERNEGAGNVNAFSVNYFRDWSKKFKSEIGYGYYDMPGVTNIALNKYSMPSYHHVLADVSYNFSGFMKGLQAEALYTFKIEGESVESGRLTINKVNMHHFNLILNYHL
jgi:outer membrane porin, OprD family